jgi:hypothetical protein
MIAKDNILASISSNRHRTFSHVVRYRTYLTPPSNPFREGKSKFQVLRECVLVILVCTVALMAMSRLFYHRPIDVNNSATNAGQRPSEALLVRHVTKGVSNTQATQEKAANHLSLELRSELESPVGSTKHSELYVDNPTQPGITKTKSKDATEQMGSELISIKALSQSAHPAKTLRVQEGSAIPLTEDFHKVIKPLDTFNERIVNQVQPSDQNYVPREREESHQARTNIALVQVETS